MEEDNIQMQLTPEEQYELRQYITSSAPVPEQNQNAFTFLNNVAESDDTTKTGYLTNEEVGSPKLPIRTLKELSLFCSEVANMPEFANYFNKEAEIITSTSLSKEAKLLELVVTSRRQLEDVTKRHRENKSWFKKKNKEVNNE